MGEKICPACSSADTIPIIYGYPTPEAMLAAERGEIALGGCCIIESQPQRHCKKCGLDFDCKFHFDS
ncbi:MAG: hypothetical protein PHD05_08470 [Sphaerochaetaceae bacterium]|nr:hypothetical protein [Sphaerochaetaceae bacterium]